jgi:hypothetical protein
MQMTKSSTALKGEGVHDDDNKDNNNATRIIF